MRGVSTKYLGFYIMWYQFINQSKIQAFKKEEIKFDLADVVCDNITKDRFGFELYPKSEISFLKFLKQNGTLLKNCFSIGVF